jgi:hypothetical protein
MSVPDALPVAALLLTGPCGAAADAVEQGPRPYFLIDKSGGGP